MLKTSAENADIGNYVDIEPKDGFTAMGLAAMFGSSWMWIKAKLRKNDAETILIKKRIMGIERRFTNAENEPIFTTRKECDKEKSNLVRAFKSEFKHVIKAVDDLSEKVDNLSSHVGEIQVGIAVLEEKVNDKQTLS